MVGCIVISHGNIARALIQACKQITGRADGLMTFDSKKLGAKDLFDKISEIIDSRKFSDGVFILISLKGGSYWNVGARIIKKYDNVVLISGMNLPLVLSFITKKDKMSFAELADVMYNDAIRGVNILGGKFRVD